MARVSESWICGVGVSGKVVGGWNRRTVACGGVGKGTRRQALEIELVIGLVMNPGKTCRSVLCVVVWVEVVRCQ